MSFWALHHAEENAEYADLQPVFDRVADAIATVGYAVVDDFLSPAEVATLRTVADATYQGGHFQSAGIGRGAQRQHNTAVRSDVIHWLDHHDPHGPFGAFFGRLGLLITSLNRSCYLGIRDLEMHLAIYPIGTFYARHLDVFKQSSGRVLSVICYLNAPDWAEADGGQLRIFVPATTPETPETHVDVLPLGGRLVCFLSDQLEHEVRTAHRPRYSITGWMRREG